MRDPARKFADDAFDAALLSHDEERELFLRFQREGDRQALDRIMLAHYRICVSMAWKHRAYGLPHDDLVQSACLGLLDAARKFDPDRGVRFTTYGRWYALAALRQHILDNWSVVRIATTNRQRQLFYTLRALRNAIQRSDDGELSENDAARIAGDYYDPADVLEMDARLRVGRSCSLSAPLGDESDTTLQDLLADPEQGEDATVEALDRKEQRRRARAALEGLEGRERMIVLRRYYQAPAPSLRELAQELGLSPERVRQLEARAFRRIRLALGVQEVSRGKDGGEA